MRTVGMASLNSTRIDLRNRNQLNLSLCLQLFIQFKLGSIERVIALCIDPERNRRHRDWACLQSTQNREINHQQLFLPTKLHHNHVT